MTELETHIEAGIPFSLSGDTGGCMVFIPKQFVVQMTEKPDGKLYCGFIYSSMEEYKKIVFGLYEKYKTFESRPNHPEVVWEK